jgi:hypothetical protein
MPDNDERDPLESWLSDEVRPILPPSGTFDLIIRRARRRKLRRLAVTVGSAAVVAAAVAVAVPGVGALRLIQAPATGVPVANGSRPTASAGQRPDGTASRLPTPPSSVNRGNSATTPPSGPVPADFAPVSVTFDSTDTGWVIGQAGTPGHCATNYCTSIARTNDAGRSWAGVPAPIAGAPAGAAGVSGIRFLDGVNGWAFGPELWATHDAGRTWQSISTSGQRVTDLETAGDRAYALFATCPGAGVSATFAMGCDSYTLMTTTAGSDNWTPVGASTTGLVTGPAAGVDTATSGAIALTSTTGYLLAPDGTLYSGPLGSPWQQVGTAPCQPGEAQADGQPSQALLALSSSTQLALACTGTSGVRIYTSSDSGATWSQQAAPAVSGTVTSLAATSSGTLILAGTGGMQVLPAGSGADGTQAAQGGPTGGFSYVGMTTDTQGVALPADAGLHEIWMTFDGGLTWTAYPVR